MMTTITLPDFDALVERHSREIFSYLWRMLRDPQDAEDALQVTFLRAFQAYPRLREGSNPRAWLYKIATNAAYTQLSRHNRHTSRLTDLSDDNALAANPVDFEQQEQLEAILGASESLPYKQRAALLLRNYQGLSYDEIGETLDCSPGSARANAYQALKKLRIQFVETKT